MQLWKRNNPNVGFVPFALRGHVLPQDEGEVCTVVLSSSTQPHIGQLDLCWTCAYLSRPAICLVNLRCHPSTKRHHRMLGPGRSLERVDFGTKADHVSAFSSACLGDFRRFEIPGSTGIVYMYRYTTIAQPEQRPLCISCGTGHFEGLGRR